MNTKTCFKLFAVVVLLTVHSLCKVHSLPLETEGQIMYNGLFTAREFLDQTFPKLRVHVKSARKVETKLKLVLKSYNEIIDLVAIMDQLYSSVDAGSGENNETVLAGRATQSILHIVLQDACEWMKNEVNVDKSLDCSDQGDVQRMFIHAAASVSLNDIDILVKDFNKANNDESGRYCHWFFCNMHPECAGQSSSKSIYLYIKNNLNCPSDMLDNLSCKECNMNYNDAE